jgi:hypothetical protein
MAALVPEAELHNGDHCKLSLEIRELDLAGFPSEVELPNEN